MRRAQSRSSSRATSARWRRWSLPSAFAATSTEQAALGIRTQAQVQAEAQGTTLSAMLVDQKISLEQYERMTALQASDMVNQGLALDAWARHYGIEPSEEDVMEMIESMAPGHEKELLKELSQDPAQLEALSIAVMRFAANKHLAATAIVE